jgi:hypothetical protein
MSQSSNRFKIVFLLGLSHCGSTLLGRMLDMHPRIFCAGEMMRIKSALASREPCSCGKTLDQCSLWKPLLPLFESYHHDYRQFQPRLYEQIAQTLKTDLVFDLSKDLPWKRTRWWWRSDIGYIFLIRDLRGMFCSKKRLGRTLERSLRRFRKWMKRLWLFTRIRRKRAIHVFYEDLIIHPEREIQRILRFLGLEVVPQIFRPSDQEHHFIASSTSKYLKGSNELRIDERWQQELTADEIDRLSRLMESIPFMRDRYMEKNNA